MACREEQISELLIELDSADKSRVAEIIDCLGRNIAPDESEKFRTVIVRFLKPMTLDVSDWTRPAIKITLEEAAKRNINLTLKRGPKTFSSIRLPTDSRLLEMFVDGVYSGEW